MYHVMNSQSGHFPKLFRMKSKFWFQLELDISSGFNGFCLSFSTFECDLQRPRRNIQVDKFHECLPCCYLNSSSAKLCPGLNFVQIPCWSLHIKSCRLDTFTFYCSRPGNLEYKTVWIKHQRGQGFCMFFFFIVLTLFHTPGMQINSRDYLSILQH